MFLQTRRTALSLFVVAFLPAAAQQARGGDGLPPRDEWQKVPEILAALGAAPGQRVADVAAGKGYLTKPLSTAVGKTGRVYAVEIGEEELAALRTLSQQEGFTNIEVIVGSESDPRLPANLDAAVILNSYHELSDYKSTLAGIKRALRPGGLLVLVDNAAGAGWFTERNDQASHHALDPKYVDAELRAAGFEIVKRRDDFIVQPYAQWLIVARPSAR
jgi:predicted methyltransferase